MNDMLLNNIVDFFKDDENIPKIFICNKVYTPYTNITKNSNKYDNYQTILNKFNNEKYFRCRIFTVDNTTIAKYIIKLVDAHYNVLEETINNKYDVIEEELFVLYSNENFIQIINMLFQIEYINALENSDKTWIYFMLYIKLYYVML